MTPLCFLLTPRHMVPLIKPSFVTFSFPLPTLLQHSGQLFIIHVTLTTVQRVPNIFTRWKASVQPCGRIVILLLQENLQLRACLKQKLAAPHAVVAYTATVSPLLPSPLQPNCPNITHYKEIHPVRNPTRTHLALCNSLITGHSSYRKRTYHTIYIRKLAKKGSQL